MLTISSLLMLIGAVVGGVGIGLGLLLVIAWINDRWHSRQHRHPNAFEIPDPQAKPAPRFTHKPALPDPRLQTLNPRR